MNVLEYLRKIETSLEAADGNFEDGERRYGFQNLGNARRSLHALIETLNAVETVPAIDEALK